MRTPISRCRVLVALLLACAAAQMSCASGQAEDASDARAARSGGERSSLAAEALADPPPTGAVPSEPAEPAVRVLFIGDGYTFANGGVDAVLAALARAKGRNFACTAVASAGKSLEWHWEEGDARATIARGGWDFVVLQEHATRPVSSPQLMSEFARKFDAEVSRAGATTVLFQTWARFHEPENQPAIARAYAKLAEELGAPLAPVGAAFERTLELRPGLMLHADDRSHPSEAGTYLAACILYATLTGDAPERLPSTVTTASGKTISLSPADAKVLHRAAAAAVNNVRSTPQKD